MGDRILIGPSGAGGMLVPTGSTLVDILAIAEEGTTIYFESDQTLTANLSVADGLEIVPTSGAKIIHGAYTVTYPGSTEKWADVQVFDGTGAVDVQNPCPQWFGAVRGGTVESSDGLQKFFDCISDFSTGTARCEGTYLIDTGLTLGPTYPSIIKTKHVVGHLKLITTTAIDTMLTIQGLASKQSGFVWDGLIGVLGVDGAAFATRTCRRGIYASGIASARFGGFYGRGFYEDCLHIDDALGSNAVSDLGYCEFVNCGSGATSYTLSANWSDRTDEGVSNAGSQRTSLTVDALPPTLVDPSDANVMVFVSLSGKLYYVYDIDRDLSTLSVYPWVDSTVGATGTLEYMFGSGLFIKGSDSGIINAEGVNSMNCGIGFYPASLYGHTVNQYVAQNCGIGIAIGASPVAAMLTAFIGVYYAEGNTYDILKVTSVLTGVLIGGDYELNYNKMDDVHNPRSSANILGGTASLIGVTIAARQAFMPYEKKRYHQLEAGSTIPVTINGPDKTLIVYKDAPSINFAAFNLDLNKCFGYDSHTVVVMGTGTNNQPTGAVTFTATSGTVNGSSTYAYSSFKAAPAVFYVSHNTSSDYGDYRVGCVSLSGL